MVVGIEPSEDVANYARDKMGVSVHRGTLADVRPLLSGQQFDVVAMFHVLEHLPSPTTALMNLHSLLAPGGVLFLEVPNAVDRARLRQPVEGFLRPIHLYNFTWGSLLGLLKRTGFMPLMEDRSVGTRCLVVAKKVGEVPPAAPLSSGRVNSSTAVVAFFGLWHAVTWARRITSLLTAGPPR